MESSNKNLIDLKAILRLKTINRIDLVLFYCLEIRVHPPLPLNLYYHFIIQELDFKYKR